MSRDHHYDDRPYPIPRLHPYVAANLCQNHYVDFKASPERIEATLGDFAQFADRQAVQTFYALVRQINGADSHLESSDCALGAPSAHRNPNSTLALAIHGRLVLLYTHLPYNFVD